MAEEELRLLKGEQFVDTENAKARRCSTTGLVYDHDLAIHGNDPAYAEKLAEAASAVAALEQE